MFFLPFVIAGEVDHHTRASARASLRISVFSLCVIVVSQIGAKPPFATAPADVRRHRIAPFVAHGSRFFWKQRLASVNPLRNYDIYPMDMRRAARV
jgi:hypothetical protein